MKSDKEIMKRLIIPAVIVLFILAGESLADSSIQNYRDRIALAQANLESLMEDEGDAGESVSQIKSWLPQKERLESNGQIIEVDNQWLHSLLDQYKAEKDEDKKFDKLDEALSRLAALESNIEQRKSSGSELPNAAEHVQSILSRAEYREKVEDPISKFIRETRQRVFDLLQRLYQWAVEALFGSSQQASWIFRIIVIVLVGSGLYFLFQMIIRRKRGSKRKKTRTVLGEEIEEGMTPRDLAQASEAAARAGDFRSAIRKLYISLLYELAERQLIELEPNATNHDYLSKLSRFNLLAPPMRYLTDRFDYTWYGMYPSSHDDYQTCLNRYHEAMQQAQSLEQPA